MTAQTIETATGSAYAHAARPARLRLWLTRLRNLSMQVELDPHLAEDIGQRSYGAPVLPRSWTEAFKESAEHSRALAWRLEEAAAFERCERGYDAPVLEASWVQATQEAARRWLNRMITMLSGMRGAFAANPVDDMDRHVARDIGAEFEALSVKQVQIGRDGYV